MAIKVPNSFSPFYPFESDSYQKNCRYYVVIHISIVNSFPQPFMFLSSGIDCRAIVNIHLWDSVIFYWLLEYFLCWRVSYE